MNIHSHTNKFNIFQPYLPRPLLFFCGYISLLDVSLKYQTAFSGDLPLHIPYIDIIIGLV